MAYIAFEHKYNQLPIIKRKVMAAGSGGDYVHCEIVLNEYGNKVCSSWYPKGVEIRQHRGYAKPENWVKYDLGSIDLYIKRYFDKHEGKKYTLSGLVFNMMLNGNYSSNRTFCSQICFDALQNVPFIDLGNYRSSSLSPNDLERIIRENNYQQLNLAQQWH